jgi:hypothetical protein
MKTHLRALIAGLLLAACSTNALAVTISLPNASGHPGDPDNVPMSISNGAGITDLSAIVDIDFTKLSITGGTVNPTLAGSSFTVTTAGSGPSGSATVTFHSPTPLAAGSVNLGDLDGLVPNAAIIGSTPLHFSSESINGGAIQASASDGTFTVLPEPATLGLASTAGLLLRRSHRRSYR